MVEAEILSALGRHEEAAKRLKDSISSAETFQAHESLARVYEKISDSDAAITENQWLVRNRGRAIVECYQDKCQAGSLIDWALARYRLGRLYELTGQRKEAASYYSGLLEHWHGARGLRTWEDARQRLAALEPSHSEAPVSP